MEKAKKKGIARSIAASIITGQECNVVCDRGTATGTDQKVKAERCAHFEWPCYPKIKTITLQTGRKNVSGYN